MVNIPNKPTAECVCQGKGWIDLGPAFGDENVHFWQCGGLVAHGNPNDARPGCGRIIRATPEEMAAGGRI